MDNIRGRSPLSSKTNLRDSLISLSFSSIPYHEHIEINNNLLNVDFQELINGSQLSYKDNTGDKELVSKAANTNNMEKIQHSIYKGSVLKTVPKPCGRGTSNNKSNSILQDTFNI